MNVYVESNFLLELTLLQASQGAHQTIGRCRHRVDRCFDLLAAARHRTTHGLTPHDAVVYSSVLAHLDSSDRSPSCFLNADARDFDDPELVEELARHNCELIPRFDAGHQFLLAHR